MDAVWDRYPPEDNLKAHAQQRRGNSPRARVGDGSTPIPKSEWNSGFLKNEDNKNELFSFISRQICKSDVNGTLLLSTYFDRVLTNRNFDVSGRGKKTAWVVWDSFPDLTVALTLNPPCLVSSLSTCSGSNASWY